MIPYFVALFVAYALVFTSCAFAQNSAQTQGVLLGPGTPTINVYDKLPKPLDTYSPAETIGKVLNILFSFIALLAVSFVMYGGFLWVSSGGEAEKAKKAQGLLVDAAVGLVVLGSVWALSWLIIKTLAEKVITP